MSDSHEDLHRFELKSMIKGRLIDDLMLNLSLHPSSLRKIYPDRTINNIYFESNNYLSLNDNIDGISNRKKLRLRWYGNKESPDNLCIESKCKLNGYGWKKKQLINSSVCLVKSWRQIKSNLESQVHDNFTRLALSFSHPVIINSYKRQYFGDFNESIRITVDTEIRYFDQRFYKKPNFHINALADENLIVEIKSNRKNRKFLESFLQNFSFPISKNSKYVTAMFAIGLN